MNKRAQRWTLLCAALLSLAAAWYLSGAGYWFLPFPKPSNFKGQTMEMRTYASLRLPPTEGFPGLRYQVAHPGQAKLFAVAAEMAKASPHHRVGWQKVLESLGYKFPEGCWAATSEVVPCLMIQHYPSMLDRIQKDLHLRLVSVDALPLPKRHTAPPGSADDTQPVPSGTNRTSSAAGSLSPPLR
jgi:hypothetical protein